MDSSYFGLANNERVSSASSSRKGKKSNSISDKPKQPQRGLGVAKLEKIRLHAQIPSAYHHHHHHPPLHHEEVPRILQMPYSTAPLPSSFSSSSSYAIQSHITMSLPEYERTNMIIYDGDSLPANTPRWEWDHDNNTIWDAESNITRPFLNLYDSQDIDMKKKRSGSLGSNSSQNSESSDTHILDLELRLSL